MKLLSILIITLALSACGMSIEEYNARVKYCKDNSMGTTIIRNKSSKVVYEVMCQDSDGNSFDSKESK